MIQLFLVFYNLIKINPILNIACFNNVEIDDVFNFQLILLNHESQHSLHWLDFFNSIIKNEIQFDNQKYLSFILLYLNIFYWIVLTIAITTCPAFVFAVYLLIGLNAYYNLKFQINLFMLLISAVSTIFIIIRFIVIIIIIIALTIVIMLYLHGKMDKIINSFRKSDKKFNLLNLYHLIKEFDEFTRTLKAINHQMKLLIAGIYFIGPYLISVLIKGIKIDIDHQIVKLIYFGVAYTW